MTRQPFTSTEPNGVTPAARRGAMTVEGVATGLGLWALIRDRVTAAAGERAPQLLERLARLPIKRSGATRRLGSYASRGNEALCIRLQFAQERAALKETLLHEIAHFCEHQTRPPAQKRCRAHGPRWQDWARVLGVEGGARGESAALERLHQERLKLVAVCHNCGAEFRRVRRLSTGRRYYHSLCGGQLRLL